MHSQNRAAWRSADCLVNIYIPGVPSLKYSPA